jgi:hypothetical protein
LYLYFGHFYTLVDKKTNTNAGRVCISLADNPIEIQTQLAFVFVQSQNTNVHVSKVPPSCTPFYKTRCSNATTHKTKRNNTQDRTMGNDFSSPIDVQGTTRNSDATSVFRKRRRRDHDNESSTQFLSDLLDFDDDSCRLDTTDMSEPFNCFQLSHGGLN